MMWLGNWSGCKSPETEKSPFISYISKALLPLHFCMTWPDLRCDTWCLLPVCPHYTEPEKCGGKSKNPEGVWTEISWLLELRQEYKMWVCQCENDILQYLKKCLKWLTRQSRCVETNIMILVHWSVKRHHFGPHELVSASSKQQFFLAISPKLYRTCTVHGPQL